MSNDESSISWVVLTIGNRPTELANAVSSLRGNDASSTLLVVSNGAGPLGKVTDGVTVVETAANVGIPGGRDLGANVTKGAVVGFLDDDAEFRGSIDTVVEAFTADPTLGSVSFRIVDEDGDTSRRHVPGIGGGGVDANRDVAYFLGGACAIRREAYEAVGGYFTELFYGHEELELSWRLIDAGWRIRYLADVEVFHPRTDISRHPDGWYMTGRNRVWIARRTLPWPVALVHVAFWFVVGNVRAPKGECRRQYRRGWRDGWKASIDHRPIRWRTVWRLTRLGRPPIV